MIYNEDMRIRIIYSVLLLVVTFFCIPGRVYSAGEFTTGMDSTYTVLPSGETQVKKVFSLKNNISTVYAKKYGIELSSNRITNVVVYDQTGTLPANLVQTENSTVIGIEFQDKVVGKDSVRNFTVEYTDPDTAIVNGNILELYIPRTAEPESFDAYDITLRVPKQFGSAAIVNPPDYALSEDQDYRILQFRNQGKEKGLSVLFGEKQIYGFSLTYHLYNPTGNRGVIQIALPPDTPYQKMLYADIEPRPDNIENDSDGNWIATYIMESSQEQTVTARGSALVYLKPTVPVPAIAPTDAHLQPDQYWEVDNSIITGLATKYQTPRQIYDYVVNTLNYNYARLDAETTRLGAVQSIQDPNNAVCQEFTDVFISLARANKIPARQATGYAFTQNSKIRPLSLVQDVLHAWPEYYDEGSEQWIPIDPTWANTTGGVDYFSQLDFSHLVFAYQGSSSTKPYPAGAYKLDQVETKDISIQVQTQEPYMIPSLDVSIEQPLSSPLGMFGQHGLVITNTTGQALYNTVVELSASQGLHIVEPVLQIAQILPYQKIRVPVTINSEQLFQKDQGEVTVTIGENTSIHQVTATPKVQAITPNQRVLIIVASVGTGTLLLITILLLIRRKRRSS